MALLWERQRWPIPPGVTGLDAECEVMEDIISDPIFKEFTEDLVPLVNLNYVPEFGNLSEKELKMHQQLVLARFAMKMIYE